MILRSETKKVFYRIALWLSVAITGIVILLPVYWIFLSSITPREKIFTFPINYIPVSPTLENYIKLFSTMDFGFYIYNTAIIIFFALSLSTLFSILAAYAFARIKFRGSGIAILFILLSSILPATTTVIPLFQLYRKLDLIDKLGGLTILYISLLLPFTTWIMVSFLKQIPVSLEEAAWVDGSGFLRTIVTIIMPLMKPAVSTILIINFISCMNEFMTPLIFTLHKVKTLTIGMIEVSTISHYYVPWENISAFGSLMLIPIIIFIIIFQRQIMEGLMAGGVKM